MIAGLVDGVAVVHVLTTLVNNGLSGRPLSANLPAPLADKVEGSGTSNSYVRSVTCRISVRRDERFSGYVGTRAGILRRSCSPPRQLDLFIQFDKRTGCCGAHSLAEVYSTLTRMPGKHRIGSEQAILFIGNIRERLGCCPGRR